MSEKKIELTQDELITLLKESCLIGLKSKNTVDAQKKFKEFIKTKNIK